MGNCPVTAYVDFGEGPVKIRCTERGKHTQCKTEILIYDEEFTAPSGAVVKHNIFKDQED